MAALPSELTAGEAATAIRDRRLSPLELVDGALARIEALDGTVQAFCFIDQENARRDAGILGQEAARGAFRGALHGVPFAVKDIFCTAASRPRPDRPCSRGMFPASTARPSRA